MSKSETTMDANTRAARATVAGINTEALKAVKTRVDEVGWKLCHHLPVPLLSLTLDEALALGVLLERVVPRTDGTVSQSTLVDRTQHPRNGEQGAIAPHHQP